jgi:predicted peptidase
MSQQPQFADLTYTRHVRLPYLLYLPRGYDATKRYPLILFLHGSGERGTDLDLVRFIGLPHKLDTWDDCPFIVVSPQCPAHSRWVFLLDPLDALLDDVLARYAVDERRVILTGMSMGGEGAWSLAAYRPERFAALVAICGRNSPMMALWLKDMPIWVFHGAQDDVVPLSASETMVAALRKAGNNPRFTVYPDAGHDSWTQAYDEPELYPWLLAQTKK